jgi:hypothetical protein
MLCPDEPLRGQDLILRTFHPDDVPDARLYRRMQKTATKMLRSVLNEGDERSQKIKRAEQRGAARLYANPRIDADLLASRAAQRSIEAIVSLPAVLIAHDSSEFDEHGRNEPPDAGPLRSSEARGYLVHNGVMVDPSCEARVGMAYLRAWTRPFPPGKPPPPGHRRVQREWDNEDDKWAWGVERAEKALARHGFQGQVRHVADHDGSSYATLAKCKHRRRFYITRTESDRCIREGGGKLFDYLRSLPMADRWTVEVEEDTKSERRGASRPRRTAEVEMRFAPVTLQKPNRYTGRRYRHGLRVWAVNVHEPNPPEGSKPLEWMLLVTMPVETTEAAREVVSDYGCRWGVEDIYKIIKSACHAELATVPDLASFRRLMAFTWPIAVHIARWTYAARVRPLEPAEPHLGDESLEALKEACRYHKLPLPRRAWTLQDVILRLAQMGGYEPRKNGKPGWKVIWRGWRVFSNFWDHLRYAQHRTASPHPRPPRRHPPAPSPSDQPCGPTKPG